MMRQDILDFLTGVGKMIIVCDSYIMLISYKAICLNKTVLKYRGSHNSSWKKLVEEKI